MLAAQGDEDRRADALACWMAGGEGLRTAAGTLLEPLPPEQLCFVVAGWLLRQRPLLIARPATLGIHLPGDAPLLDVCFGASPLDTLYALSDVELLCRPLLEFRTAAAKDEALLSAALARLAYDAALLREGLAAVGHMDAQERLVTFLYQTRRRLVACSRIEPDDLTFELPMTQHQLANAIGVTSVHVNRVLRTLRTAAVLRVANSQVEIMNRDEFTRIGSTLTR